MWYFRRDLTTSAREFVLTGLLPLLGAVALTFVFVPEGEHAVVVSHDVPAGADVDVDSVENVLDVLEEELERRGGA